MQCSLNGATAALCCFKSGLAILVVSNASDVKKNKQFLNAQNITAFRRVFTDVVTLNYCDV